MNKQYKENYKVTTKIPVPVPPLPALPQHLLMRRAARAPLNTLAGPNNGFAQNANLAGPSSEQNRFKTKKDSPFKIDTRFVAIKRGCEYSVPNSKARVAYVSSDDDREGNDVEVDKSDFSHKDDRRTSEPSVIYISSDDDLEGDEFERTNDDNPSMSTPARHMLQPASIKKTKRSLKRPHSKELQCISPRPNQDVLMEDNGVKRQLIFKFNPTTDEKIEAAGPRDLLTDRLEGEYSSDIISYYLQTEVKAAPPKVKNDTRGGVINWLMKIDDGNPATIQRAIWYLDKRMSSSIVSLENMQLVAAASFWIASKIEGPVVSASRLVKYSNNAFNKRRLLDAEKDILMKLKFPSLTVIPQDFLSHMASWCDRERPCEVSKAASFLCLCGMMVNKRLCQEYPSVVAAAAIRCALLLLRKNELMTRLQKCSLFVAAEEKAENFSSTCMVLHHAVQTVASQKYPYINILKIYGTPPAYIAQKIIRRVNELSNVGTRRVIY